MPKFFHRLHFTSNTGVNTRFSSKHFLSSYSNWYKYGVTDWSRLVECARKYGVPECTHPRTAKCKRLAGKIACVSEIGASPS